MKTKLFLATLFLFSIVAFAQDKVYGKPEILLGKNVRVLPINEYAYNKKYKGFYANEELNKSYKGEFDVSPQHLENRIFKVLDVVKLRMEGPLQYYRIKIQDSANNEILYYRYTKANENGYEYYFGVEGGLVYPPGFFCDMVVEKRNNGVLKIYSNTEHVKGNFIDKSIALTSKKAEYELYLSATNKKGPIKPKGIKLTLKSGKILDLPAQPFKYDDIDKEYKTRLTLNKAQIDILRVDAITGIQMGGIDLYIYEPEFEYIKNILNCLVDIKQ